MENRKIDSVAEVLCRGYEFYDQAYDFAIDWLKELKKMKGDSKVEHKIARSHNITLKKWGAWYTDSSLSEINHAASRVMDWIRERHPEVDKLA